MATISAMYCSSEKRIDRSLPAVIVPPAIIANLRKNFSKLDGKEVVVSFLGDFLFFYLSKIKHIFFFFFIEHYISLESTRSSRRILDTSTEHSDKKSTKFICKKGQQQPNILISKVSRFGFGVPEKCSSALVLGSSRRDYRYNNKLTGSQNPIDIYELIESSVRMWEDRQKDRRSRPRKNRRHLRRYGLITAAYFFRALGPWSVQSGERESVQGRRTLSEVNIRRQYVEPELRLPVSRRQLVASVSCSALEPGGCSAIGPATREQVILFWTPEYWYRPRAAITAYRLFFGSFC